MHGMTLHDNALFYKSKSSGLYSGMPGFSLSRDEPSTLQPRLGTESLFSSLIF